MNVRIAHEPQLCKITAEYIGKAEDDMPGMETSEHLPGTGVRVHL